MRGRGPQRVGGRDREGLGPSRRRRARDRQAVVAAGGHSKAGDGILDIANGEGHGTRAAAGRERLVVGHVDRVGRQARGAERDGPIDRDAVVGRGRGPRRVSGRDREGLRPGRRGRARDAQQLLPPEGTARPAMAFWILVTAKVSVPVPPLAVSVWW